MKKVLLSLIAVFALAGCGSTTSSEASSQAGSITPSEASYQTESSQDSIDSGSTKTSEYPGLDGYLTSTGFPNVKNLLVQNGVEIAEEVVTPNFVLKSETVYYSDKSLATDSSLEIFIPRDTDSDLIAYNSQLTTSGWILNDVLGMDMFTSPEGEIILLPYFLEEGEGYPAGITFYFIFQQPSDIEYFESEVWPSEAVSDFITSVDDSLATYVLPSFAKEGAYTYYLDVLESGEPVLVVELDEATQADFLTSVEQIRAIENADIYYEDLSGSENYPGFGVEVWLTDELCVWMQVAFNDDYELIEWLIGVDNYAI